MGFLKKIIFLWSCFLVFSRFSASLIATEENRPGLSLKETFELYVRSLQNSDLESLFTTVTDEEKFFFLTSEGKLIDSRASYYTFHKDWFKQTEWEMPVDLLEVQEGKEYGYTTAIFHYRRKMPDGGLYVLDSYFTLIFHREDEMWKVVADVCTPLSRYTSEANPEIRYTPNQTFLFEIIKTRRTVRRYKPTPVPREHILKIIDAARFAPTAGNQQPWKFLVIQDRQKLDQLQKEAPLWYLEDYKKRRQPAEEEFLGVKKAVEEMVGNALSAPVYIAVLVNSRAEYPNEIIHDGTLAAGYLMIAARALGYGTGFFTTFFPEGKMKEVFEIPDQYRLICFTPVGIPEKWPQTPPKKRLEEVVVFESFGKIDEK